MEEWLIRGCVTAPGAEIYGRFGNPYSHHHISQTTLKKCPARTAHNPIASTLENRPNSSRSLKDEASVTIPDR